VRVQSYEIRACELGEHLLQLWRDFWCLYCDSINACDYFCDVESSNAIINKIILNFHKKLLKAFTFFYLFFDHIFLGWIELHYDILQIPFNIGIKVKSINEVGVQSQVDVSHRKIMNKFDLGNINSLQKLSIWFERVNNLSISFAWAQSSSDNGFIVAWVSDDVFSKGNNLLILKLFFQSCLKHWGECILNDVKKGRPSVHFRICSKYLIKINQDKYI